MVANSHTFHLYNNPRRIVENDLLRTSRNRKFLYRELALRKVQIFQGNPVGIVQMEFLPLGIRFHEIRALLESAPPPGMRKFLERPKAIERLPFDMALRQTAKVKLLASVFSCLFGRLKIVVFVVNSRRHFSICVI